MWSPRRDAQGTHTPMLTWDGQHSGPAALIGRDSDIVAAPAGVSPKIAFGRVIHTPNNDKGETAIGAA